MNSNVKRNVGLIAVATPLMLGMALASPAEAGRTWAKVQAEVCVPSPGTPAIPAVYALEYEYQRMIDEGSPAIEAEYGFEKWKWAKVSKDDKILANVGADGFGEWKTHNGNLGWFPENAELNTPYSPGDNENAGTDWFRKIEVKAAVDAVPPTFETTWVIDPADLEGEGWGKTGDERLSETILTPAIPAVPPVECPLPNPEPQPEPNPDPDPAPKPEEPQIGPPVNRPLKSKCADFSQGNFTRDDSRYALHLDGDKDGVACEKRSSAPQGDEVTALPKTGAESWVLATAALGLIGAGTATLVLTRRRRES